MSPGEIVINVVIAVITGLITGVISGYYVGLLVDRNIKAREAAREEERWAVPKRLTYALVFQAMDELLAKILPDEVISTDPTILVYDFGYGVEGTSSTRLINLGHLTELFATLRQEGEQKFGVLMQMIEDPKTELRELEAWVNTMIEIPVPTIKAEFIQMLLKLRQNVRKALEQEEKGNHSLPTLPDIENLSLEELEKQLEKQMEDHNDSVELIDAAYSDVAKDALHIWDWLEKQSSGNPKTLEEKQDQIERNVDEILKEMRKKRDLLNQMLEQQNKKPRDASE